ncbi:hypothetical protein [Flexivirga caeni]|uniref:Uncharacterized protein n=1 Tax=Flexivirga caeni TaxID=2294115 RepID=A0A3M9MKD4_9MICO|nr:hypothetical protein [Flexivirga caeni]RNI25128.1 hypothetical protein EFY87_00275 [Flexivirga caeni]
MTHSAAETSETSTLSIHFEVGDNPDWPEMALRVDGKNPFETVAEGWRGFDPADILGGERPLLPVHIGRRVAVYRCSCGVPGCGVIAPWIERSPDGRRISWMDFRNYTGVFDGPVRDDVDRFDGRAWGLPAIHFEAAQYEAEVCRAAADRSWETPRRLTARLVETRLRAAGFSVAPEFRLQWVSPAWRADGVELSFGKVGDTPRSGPAYVGLRIPCDNPDPDEAAREIVALLSATPPEDRIRAFGEPWN